MVFIYCKNCGHSEHKNKCGFEHWLGICNCDQYEENRINNIRELEKQIQLVNEEDKAYRDKKRNNQTIDSAKWFRTHLKLRVLDDRWFRHYGLWNYRIPDPI